MPVDTAQSKEVDILNRVALSLVTLVSLAMSTLLVASFAAIGLDEPAYVPAEAVTSTSEAHSKQEGTEKRSDTSGNTQPSSSPATDSQEKERAPRTEDVEPLGEPMLA